MDDGSADETAARAARRWRSATRSCASSRHRSRQGIAEALRTAGLAARGRVFVFYPADLQFQPAEIPPLVGPILAR